MGAACGVARLVASGRLGSPVRVRPADRGRGRLLHVPSAHHHRPHDDVRSRRASGCGGGGPGDQRAWRGKPALDGHGSAVRRGGVQLRQLAALPPRGTASKALRRMRGAAGRRAAARERAGHRGRHVPRRRSRGSRAGVERAEPRRARPGDGRGVLPGEHPGSPVEQRRNAAGGTIRALRVRRVDWNQP